MNPLRWLWKQVFEDDDEPPEPHELVLLGSRRVRALADLWKGKLKAAGIGSLVRNASAIAVYGVPSFEVLVAYEDLEPARRILNLDTPNTR